MHRLLCMGLFSIFSIETVQIAVRLGVTGSRGGSSVSAFASAFALRATADKSLELRRTCLALEIAAGSAMPSPKGEAWWTHKGSNLGPLPCEGNALPLSYAS